MCIPCLTYLSPSVSGIGRIVCSYLRACVRSCWALRRRGCLPVFGITVKATLTMTMPAWAVGQQHDSYSHTENDIIVLHCAPGDTAMPPSGGGCPLGMDGQPLQRAPLWDATLNLFGSITVKIGCAPSENSTL